MFKITKPLCVTESKRRPRRVVIFVLAFLVAVSIRTTGKASASEFPSLPHSLPYNYGGYDYTRVVQYKLTDGTFYAWYYKESNYTNFILHASTNGGSWNNHYLFPANADSAQRFKYVDGSWTSGVTYDKLDDSIPLNESIRSNFDLKADIIPEGTFDFGSRYGSLGSISNYDIVQSAITLNGTDFIDPNYVAIPEFNSDYQLTVTFEYPEMVGPVFHADYQIPPITTSVPLRVRSNVPLVLAPELLQHIKIFVVQMTDATYSTVKQTNGYLETYSLSNVLNFNLFEFTPPLLGGETNYYKLIYAFDDEYLAQHPAYSVINSYNFSFTGLSPTDEDYEYGQSPVLPPLDSNGNTTGSTGSIVGDLVNRRLSESWASIESQFADIIYLYDLVKNPPLSGTAAPLYSGDFTIAERTVPVVFDPLHQFPIPPIVPNTVTMVSYVMLGWFLIRKSSELFPE